jgi:hypothetical protein
MATSVTTVFIVTVASRRRWLAIEIVAAWMASGVYDMIDDLVITG